MGLIPGSGIFPWIRKWQHTPVFFPVSRINNSYNSTIKRQSGTSLVIQWLRLLTPNRGPWVDPWSGNWMESPSLLLYLLCLWTSHPQVPVLHEVLSGSSCRAIPWQLGLYGLQYYTYYMIKSFLSLLTQRLWGLWVHWTKTNLEALQFSSVQFSSVA